MAKVTIKTPVPGYTGRVGTIQFQDGKADADPVEDAATIAYCRGRGYEVAGETVDPDPDPDPVDSREVTDPEPVGSPLRDAAVDPHEEDHLAPVGAGEADPHGPDVVSPTLAEDGHTATDPAPAGARRRTRGRN